MKKQSIVEIKGNTVALDSHLAEYLKQKWAYDEAEYEKKEETAAVLQIQKEAGTFRTNKFQFTVVFKDGTEFVKPSEILEKFPEIYNILKDAGLIHTGNSSRYITGVKPI